MREDQPSPRFAESSSTSNDGKSRAYTPAPKVQCGSGAGRTRRCAAKPLRTKVAGSVSKKSIVACPCLGAQGGTRSEATGKAAGSGEAMVSEDELTTAQTMAVFRKTKARMGLGSSRRV